MDTLDLAQQSCVLGNAALGGAMTYEKPEVRDFGSFAEYTYTFNGEWEDCFPGGSGNEVHSGNGLSLLSRLFGR